MYAPFLPLSKSTEVLNDNSILYTVKSMFGIPLMSARKKETSI